MGEKAENFVPISERVLYYKSRSWLKHKPIFSSMDPSSSFLWQNGSDVMIRVRIRPGAGRDRLVKEHHQTICIDIKAAPERGAANEALLRFLSSLFKKPIADIDVKHGHTSRNKLLIVRNCLHSEIETIILDTLGRTSNL